MRNRLTSGEVAALWLDLHLPQMNRTLNGRDPYPAKTVTATAESWSVTPMPRRTAKVKLGIEIPAEEWKSIEMGHIPAEMEDHWFMYCDGKVCRWHRSWTGICIYEADYEKQGDTVRLTTLRINDSHEQHECFDKRSEARIFLSMMANELNYPADESTVRGSRKPSGFALFTLTSSLHSETSADALSEPFIQDIEKELGESFDFHGDDFSGYGGNSDRTDVIYVRTGGTEGLFKALDLPGHIRLLTSGQSNSLAASMEILAYLRRNWRSGEILHGTAGEIASSLHGSKLIGGRRTDSSETADRHGETEVPGRAQEVIRPLPPIDLGGIRLGVIGKPSDWLIASDVDGAGLKGRLNAELVEIPMEELLRRLVLREEDMRGFKGSEAIYSALKEIVSEYGLGGLTLRCFDLLDSVHNTGCLALARLNAEGIPASCEGDVPALVTMVWLQKTRGCPGFQCNLSRIDDDKLLFAHCTVPLSMVTSYRFDTHFESGIGTAIKGEFPVGDVEICKISPDLETYVAIPGRLVGNCSEPCLCRTQVIVESPLAVGYVLHSPLANHHIIVPAVSRPSD